MSGAKEIRGKIKSVKNTQKITRAMEMVAASKMKKAQERMRAARPYGEKIREVCAHMSRANVEYRHPFVAAQTGANKTGIILVTTDKGLCGGLNTNVLRMVFERARKWEEAGRKVFYTALGGKGLGFLSRFNAEVISQAAGLGDKPRVEDLVGAITAMLDTYAAGGADEVYLVYTRFENTMKQAPVMERLLPLTDEMLSADNKPDYSWDYLYEPESKPIVDVLLRRYIEAVIYHAVCDNIASEQSARMVAMKAASDNAGNVIDELQLAYNKNRQAAITTEIAEIVGGAAAV
jgi:F-type H+-transporting ATPase subunit gamma